MNPNAFYGLAKGTALKLKPERAIAYGMNVWDYAYFDHVQENKGYKTPWIVAWFSVGERYQESSACGHFRPSDFTCTATSHNRVVPNQPTYIQYEH